MKSIAKSDAFIRDLKDKLQFRGFTVSEARISGGWNKLTLNTDEASIWIEQADAVSKDVFGNDLLAFTPHICKFASRDDAMSSLKVVQIMEELGKLGLKLNVKTHATVLATAEAAAGTDVEYDVIWTNSKN